MNNFLQKNRNLKSAENKTSSYQVAVIKNHRRDLIQKRYYVAKVVKTIKTPWFLGAINIKIIFFTFTVFVILAFLALGGYIYFIH